MFRKVSLLFFVMCISSNGNAACTEFLESIGFSDQECQNFISLCEKVEKRCPSFTYNFNDYTVTKATLADIKACREDPVAFEKAHSKNKVEETDEEKEYKQCVKELLVTQFSSTIGTPTFNISPGYYYVLDRGNNTTFMRPNNGALVKSVCKGILSKSFSIDTSTLKSKVNDFVGTPFFKCGDVQEPSSFCQGNKYVSAIGPFSENDSSFASRIGATVVKIDSNEIPEKPDCGALCW